MTKQKILLWLFPPITEKQESKNEHISNKKFIFMVTIGISLIAIMEIIK